MVRHIAPERIEVELDEGTGSFDVVMNPARTFVVSSGDVHVLVIGTSFTLERDASKTRVAVERGRVRVEWTDGARELTAGEAGWFPPASPSWQAPAEAPEAPAIHDVPAELLTAADTARRSGRADDAVPLLRRIVEHHARDPRAPLAAFTMGRVLLELDRDREAARAFAEARRLDPTGSLAEDALVREAEAWARAGDRETAQRRAQAYLSRYPEGRRAQDVRLLLR